MTTQPPLPPANLTDSTEEQEKARKKNESDERDRRAMTSASSELLFVLLPFIVIGITLGHRGEFRTILFIPEWSIVSSVIVGQSIVKLASASIGGRKVKKEAIVLIMSVLLVCFLVPILVTLAIVLTSTAISTALAGTQAVFFALSILIFWAGSVIENLGNSNQQPN